MYADTCYIGEKACHKDVHELYNQQVCSKYPARLPN